MDNEKENAPPELLWGDVPRDLRMVVYEHLRETIAKCRKDAAFAIIVHSFASQTTHGSVPSSVHDAQRAVAGAFELALAELMGLDDEICDTCGGFHDEGFSDHPPKNPKDLS